MNILTPLPAKAFPFDWVNLDYLPDSNASRFEVYLPDDTEDDLKGLKELFDTLFGSIKDSILIYDSHWGDFCLDSWDIHEDRYDYTPEGKSTQTAVYLQMLIDSDVAMGYSGSCSCHDWPFFLKTILDCVLTHIALYSPVLYSEAHGLLFYFHHTGSIGFYFKNNNEAVKQILSTAKEKYDVRHLALL